MIHHMQSVNQRVEQFHLRHGGECYSDECHWYYSDGAFRDVNKMGILADPLPPTSPENIHRNAERVVTFHRLKLKHAVQKFDDLDFRLSSTVPHDPKAALAELKQLEAHVQKCRRELAAAQAKLDATEIGKRRKEMKTWRAEELQKFQEFQQQRRAIKI